MSAVTARAGGSALGAGGAGVQPPQAVWLGLGGRECGHGGGEEGEEGGGGEGELHFFGWLVW